MQKTNEQHKIKFDDEEILTDGNETILSTCTKAGIQLESECLEGVCGVCAVEMLEGEIEYGATPIAPVFPGEILSCIAYPRSKTIILKRP